MQRVFIISGSTFDHVVYLNKLPDPVPSTIHVAPFNEGTGSTGAGKALNLAKPGVSHVFYNVLGDDSYGHHITEDLRNNLVDFFMRSIQKEPNGKATGHADASEQKNSPGN